MADDAICQPFPPCENLDGRLLVLRTLEGPSLAAVEGIAFEGDSLLDQLALKAFLQLTYRFTWRIGPACIAPARTVLGLAPLEQITFQMRSARQLDFGALIRRAAENVHTDDTSSRTLTETTDSTVTTTGTSSSDSDTIDLGPLGTWGAGGDTTTDATETVTEDTTNTLDDVVTSTSDTQANSTTVELTAGATLTSENSITRQMENPYYDRTMEIRMHPVFREFELELTLHKVETGIAITTGKLRADALMVARHGGFLARAALDRNVLNLGVARLGEVAVPRARAAAARSDPVVQHLEANARYYAGAYVRYVRDLHGREPIADLAIRTLGKSGLVRGRQPRLVEALALERLRVAHGRVLLPARDPASVPEMVKLPEGFSAAFRHLADPAVIAKMKGRNRRVRKLHLFMGTHLEVVAGTCERKHVPPPLAEEEG